MYKFVVWAPKTGILARNDVFRRIDRQNQRSGLGGSKLEGPQKNKN